MIIPKISIYDKSVYIAKIPCENLSETLCFMQHNNDITGKEAHNCCMQHLYILLEKIYEMTLTRHRHTMR